MSPRLTVATRYGPKYLSLAWRSTSIAIRAFAVSQIAVSQIAESRMLA